MSQHTRTALKIVSIAALLLALPVTAQDLMGDLRSVDANGDQSISAAEVRQGATRQFAQIDSNHDGQISEAEFIDSRLTALAALDSDGDGSVSRAELRTRLLEARMR